MSVGAASTRPAGWQAPAERRRAGRLGGLLTRQPVVLFIAPAFLVLAALILYPLGHTALLSVTDERGLFVGLENFSAVLDDRLTGLSARNSAVYVLGSMVIELTLGTIAGIVLNQPLRGRGALRTVMLIPWVIPGIVAATTWAWMYHTEFGIISFGLMQVGIIDAPVGWLTGRDTVLPSLMVVNAWKMFPFVAVMVLAGLQSVPESLYEAAKVDGAGFLDEVRHIMLPHLRPVLLSIALLLMIWGMNAITIIYTMTRGGPANRSLIVPIQIFRQGFEQFEFHKAAALSVLLFLFLLASILIYIRVFKPTEEKGSDGA